MLDIVFSFDSPGIIPGNCIPNYNVLHSEVAMLGEGCMDFKGTTVITSCSSLVAPLACLPGHVWLRYSMVEQSDDGTLALIVPVPGCNLCTTENPSSPFFLRVLSLLS